MGEDRLIDVAIEKVGGTSSVVVGDAVWDVKAAAKAGLYSIGLLCGGFGEGELREAAGHSRRATGDEC